MTRRIASGAPWEPVVGYSRAVAAGDHVWVTGCTSLRDGEVVHERDTSMVEVSALIDPRMLVEVEAVAYRPGVGSP
jgi:enamine deaminase RidA (YjgF/YER057c/UK114 family)